jgi:hypothetical protein
VKGQRGDQFNRLISSTQVGLAAELPSGTYSDRNFDHHDFFDFLLNSGQSYEPIPLERFNAVGYLPPSFFPPHALLTIT